MKILVTGSSGRVGRAIVACLSRQHEVVGFDHVPAAQTDVVADVCDEAALRRTMMGVKAVVHSAALHAPHVPFWPESQFERVNVEGTAAVIRCCLAQGVTSLVYTSTTALYGQATALPDRAAWISEDTVPKPRTIYHRTKLQAEALLRGASERSGMQVTVLRMSRCFPEAAPLMAAYRLHRGVDAADVARAHELALVPAGRCFSTYVISGATPFEPADAEEIKVDAAAVIRRCAQPMAEAFAQRGWTLPASIDRVYSSARAEREIGWRPQLGWQSVLAQFDAESPEVLSPSSASQPLPV